MVLTLAPNALYMILCDEVLPDAHRPGKHLIVGLTTLIDWPAESTTPMQLERLVAYLILTGGRGHGTGRIVCHNEETGMPAFASPPRPVSFEGLDPTGHYGVTFRVLNCPIPAPGVYVVKFLFDDKLVQQQFLTVR
jgi:hypothetical protein